MSLSQYTDSDLQKELNRRFKKRRGPIVGYRAICSGDAYDYGSHADYRIGEYGWGKKECKKRAEECVAKSKHGGYVKELYKDTPKQGTVH